MGMISWLISLVVACVVIVLLFGSASLICYLDDILTTEQKEKISEIAHIILCIISIIVILFMLTVFAHLFIFDLRVK